jgi:hypothetical protein
VQRWVGTSPHSAASACSSPVAPSTIRACDQRIGLPGSPLVGAQCRALPFRCPALSSIKPSPRHRDLHSTKCPHQRSRSMAMAVAGNSLGAIGILGISIWLAAIARGASTTSSSASIIVLDEAANLVAQRASIGSNQSSRRAGRRLGFQLRDRRLRAITAHGVVSTGARTPDRLGFNLRLRHTQFQPNLGRHRAGWRPAGAAETARRCRWEVQGTSPAGPSSDCAEQDRKDSNI